MTEKLDNRDYICIPWPGPDFEAANDEKGDEALDEDELEEACGKQFEEARKNGIFLDLASNHPEWKWVMQWESWKMYQDNLLKSRYCDPDIFGMYISNDFHAYGLQEIAENILIEFNKEIKKPKTRSLHHLLAIMSSMGHWLAWHDLMELIRSDDGDTIKELIQIIGHAFLTILAALDDAGELKPDSSFLDLTLIMSMYLEIAHNLPDYGIEGEDVAWAREVVVYFKKANLDPKKGIARTAKHLETCAAFKGKLFSDFKKTEKNPWGFTTMWNDFAHIIGGGRGRGGNKYDITKMSRTKRAGYAFSKKDPLKDVSQDDLKNNRIMLTRVYSPEP